MSLLNRITKSDYGTLLLRKLSYYENYRTMKIMMYSNKKLENQKTKQIKISSKSVQLENTTYSLLLSLFLDIRI